MAIDSTCVFDLYIGNTSWHLREFWTATRLAGIHSIGGKSVSKVLRVLGCVGVNAVAAIGMASGLAVERGGSPSVLTFPDVVVVPPPPTGPIPIPYPNTSIPNPEGSSALAAFTLAEEATGGVIVVQDVFVE